METMGCLKLMRAVLGPEVMESVTKQWLCALKEQERVVIEKRFGLEDGNEPQTLEEVSKKFNVTGERIRQIEAKSLRKIRLAIGITKWFCGIFVG